MTAARTGTVPQLEARIESVQEVLENRELHIPEYQRPYTWTATNVSELVDDIRRFRSADHYRIGTFILHPSTARHRDGGRAPDETSHRTLDIVDGQQRYLSFALIAHALLTRHADLPDTVQSALRTSVCDLSLPRRQDGRTVQNLRRNYSHLRRIISSWDSSELGDFAEFFLSDCSVVVLAVRDLDSAFQMFDSQNTRGRPLFPTDLLKAYHLREFTRTDPDRDAVLSTVRAWEEIPPEEINHVIAALLFPIKQWSANRSVPKSGFTPQNVGLFKGIREDPTGNAGYPWARPALLAKAAVDRFHRENETLVRHGVVSLDYPFQITQPVIDGEMFFRMVEHYVHQARLAGIHPPGATERRDAQVAPAAGLSEMLDNLDSMPSGTGNRYVRGLFDCLLIAYVDRFGWYDTEAAATVLAQHAYQLRVHLAKVQSVSIDNFAQGRHERVPDAHVNLFAEIVHSSAPRALLTRPAPVVPGALTSRLSAPLRKLYAADHGSAVEREAGA